MERWEFSHGIVGVNAPSWLTFEVHRPYFDGTESPLTVIAARAAVLAARRFEQRTPTALRCGMTMPASYRRLLIEESRLVAYQVTEPSDLPDDLASPAWRTLSDAYRHHADLDDVARAGLAHWLVAVCLPEAVLTVVPADLDPARCTDPVLAGTQAARAIALFGAEGLSERTRAAYRVLVDQPWPTLAHVQSVAGWGYLLARHAGDGSAAPVLLAAARDLLKTIAGELTDFELGILETRLALREAMHAEREKDFANAAAMLATATRTAGGLTATNPDDELLVLEARRRLVDRRVEIAVRLGDRDAELAAIAEGMALDPTCVKIRMQAAQAAERVGDHEQALAGYLHAARLGPFGTAFALSHAAECARAIGETEFSRVLAERAFRAAPRSTRMRDELVAACETEGDQPLAEVTRLAGHQDPDRPYANNWHYQMYAAYFNLGESRSPGLYARLPSLAFEFAERGERPDVNWQRLMPPAFRRNLVRESGLVEFAVDHPADLPARLRTPAWDTLCGWLDEFEQSDVERQHQVAVVLFRLGFGRLVLDLVPTVPAEELRTPAELRLQHWRDVVRYVMSIGGPAATPTNSFAIAEHPACSRHLRFVIAVFAVVFHARETKSIDEAEAWRNIGAECLAELLADPGYSQFEKMMMESRFYRSVTYVPFLRRDREVLAREMARSEELARALPASTPYEEFLKRENLRACLESRSKEAYGFGDDELGHSRVAEVLTIDPYEPKTHIEVAESLLKRGRPADAANSFLRTARLGPVSTALGYASAADCFARAGKPILAEDCYVQALRLDPYAISAARGWAGAAAVGGMAHLAGEYVTGLEEWGAAKRAERTT